MNTKRNDAFTQSDWELYAKCYDGLNTLTPYVEMTREATEILEVTRGARVLDAACGTGNFAEVLLEGSGGVPQITACDYSSIMLKRAQDKCKERVNFLRLDLNQPLPFGDDAFDIIASINTLYAIKNPTLLLGEFFRVVKNGGKLLVITPKEGYQNGLILKAHCGSGKPDAYWENLHEDQMREESRIRESCGDTELSDELMLVGKFNRHIAHNARFHFFSYDALREEVTSIGFRIVSHRMTYAKQCHMVLVEKP